MLLIQLPVTDYFASLDFIGLKIAGIFVNFYDSDFLDALFLVLSILLAFTSLYQYYLNKLHNICNVAKEDFERT